MTKRAKKPFPNHICVKRELDGDYLVVAGEPRDIERLDADEGERIATYTLNGPVQVYRKHPRLEK